MALEKQMELFEDGGLMDEGGTVDPVSGNDVPPGSTQEEVRDDIPAQLSEGEFVFPADVVRYHGLDKLMEMRQEAKMGLKMMEKMGQMGNSEEATMPDDLPFDIEDLDIEDDNQPMEMQVGGYVPGQYQQGYGTYTLPGTGVMQQQPSYLSGYGQQPQQTYDYGVYNVPAYQQFTPATYTPEPYTGPTFEELIPSTTGMYDEMRRYVNADGQVRMIPFVDGRPIYPIPAGFYPEAEAKQPDIPAPTDVSTGTTRVTDEGDEKPFAPGPRLDQFGREEDPRITQVTKSEQFGKLAKEVDPRGAFTKIKDDFLGAIGASTTSQEYQKALNELSVGVANYTSDPAEQNKLIAEIRGNIGQPTRTELGMDLAPVTTDDVLAKKLAEQRQAVTPDPLLATGTAPTSVGVETARVGTTLKTVQDAENTVSGTARENVKFLNDVMNQLNITENQKMDYLVKAASGQGSQTFVTGPNRTDTVRVDFSTFTPEVSAAAQEMIDVIGNRGDENLKSMLSSSQESASDKRQADIFEKAQKDAEEKAAREAEIRKQDELRKRAEDSEKAKAASGAKRENKFGFQDDRVRDEQGTAKSVDEDGRIYYDSSHDWSQKTQTKVEEDKDETPSDSGGGCCFIMLEARYGDGTMDNVVRRYRDEHMTDRNKRGYYKLAEVFVPLMRKYPAFKWLVTKTFADPLVAYGKYYYGQNKHGVIYSPIKSFWMKVFDVLGTKTEFVRENGEVV